MIAVRRYTAPQFDIGEALRYAKCPYTDGETERRIKELFELCNEEADFAVSFCVFDLSVSGGVCDIGGLKLSSLALSKRLSKCKRVVVFAATVGAKIDRLIAKYEVKNARDALLVDAIGAERIEALCDAFCDDLAKEYGAVTARFSPGYGDLPIDAQRDIFRFLEPEKRIGLTLSESLVMCPSKSVTAFVGILD